MSRAPRLTPVALAAAAAVPRLLPGAAERVALAALVRQAAVSAEARRLVAEARRALADEHQKTPRESRD